MKSAGINLRRESSKTFVSQVYMGFIGILGVVIFARIIGPSGLGQYYFAVALIAIFTKAAGGISSAVKKRISEGAESPGQYVWSGLLLHFLSGIFIAFGIFLFRGFITQSLGGSTNVAVVIVGIFGVGTFHVIQGSYKGLGNPASGAMFGAGRLTVSLGSQLLLLWQGYGVFGVITGHVFGFVAASLAILVFTNTSIEVVSNPPLGNILSFGKWSVPTSFLNQLNGRMDIIVLTFILGNEATGIYEALKRLSMPAIVFAQSISNPLKIKVSGLDSLKNNEKIRQSINDSVSYASVLSIPIVLGALIIGETLTLTIYGSEFSGTGYLLAAVSTFQLLRVYHPVLSSAIEGLDAPEKNTLASSIALIVNGVLSIILVFEIGIFGVILASIISELFRLTFYRRITKNIIKTNLAQNRILHQIKSGLGMFFIILLLNEFLLATGTLPVARLTLVIIIGVLAYTYLLSQLDAEINSLFSKLNDSVKS